MREVGKASPLRNDSHLGSDDRAAQTMGGKTEQAANRLDDDPQKEEELGVVEGTTKVCSS